MGRRNILHFVVTILVAATWPNFARAQSSAPLEALPQSATQNTGEVLEKLNELVEQNRLLEKQNRELMDQIEILRRTLRHRLNYKFSIGNNLSNLDVIAAKLTRDLSNGVALTWEPTTGEFGPRGASGDYEEHESPATRLACPTSTVGKTASSPLPVLLRTTPRSGLETVYYSSELAPWHRVLLCRRPPISFYRPMEA